MIENKFFKSLTNTIYDESKGYQVNYDDNGVITAIFIENAFIGKLVKVDVDAFEKAHPSRYSYMQEKVNEHLLLDEAFKAIEGLNNG